MRRLFAAAVLAEAVPRRVAGRSSDGAARACRMDAAAPLCLAAHLHLSPSWHGPTRPCLAEKATHPYQCGECGKAFRLLNALNHHILTKHAGKATAMMTDGDGRLITVGSPAAARPSPPVSAASTARNAEDPAPAPASAAPATGQTPPPAAAAEDTEESSMAAASGSAGTEKEQAFVCTICQKTFRLEAALQHHYQAKHNTQMPSGVPGLGAGLAEGVSSSALGTGAARSPLGQFSTTAAGGSDGGAPRLASEFVRQQEALLPDAPAYHLEVAPNAPEEGDLAVHWRCVNTCVLVGTVTECTEGYVFEDHVLQLTVATNFDAPSPGDPDKDFHTVRVYNEAYWRPLASSLKVGDEVAISGRLRMVPQFDAGLKRYYHYPLVQVTAGAGLVRRLA